MLAAGRHSDDVRKSGRRRLLRVGLVRPRLDLVLSRCQNEMVRWPAPALSARPVKAGRWVCSAISGLLAVAQVVAFSHVAFVAHRICAEHGEAIHAIAPVESLAAPDCDSALGSVMPARGAGVGHDHEHCLCMAHSRERFVVPPRTSDVRPRVAVFQSWKVSQQAWPAPARALFLLAPKASPPASL